MTPTERAASFYMSWICRHGPFLDAESARALVRGLTRTIAEAEEAVRAAIEEAASQPITAEVT